MRNTKNEMNITYNSNNSGGSWWLKDEDWFALEAAGWAVDWHKNNPEILFLPEDGRCLGALAGSASKDFPSVGDAIREFESITKEDASAEGCNCCGAPHSFEWTDESGKWDYVSGSRCLDHMFEKVPTSLREAAEQMNA